MAHVKKTFSLEERSAALLEQYARDLHVSQSALLSMFITNLDQGIRTVVSTVGTEEQKAILEERESAGQPGDD